MHVEGPALKCEEPLSLTTYDRREESDYNHRCQYLDTRQLFLKGQALAALFILVSPNLESLTLSPLVDLSQGIFPMRIYQSSWENVNATSFPLTEFLDGSTLMPITRKFCSISGTSSLSTARLKEK